MKNILLLLLILTVFSGCKKEQEEERLMKMKLALSNDWNQYAHETIEPLKFRLKWPYLDPCNKLVTWSFKTDGDFRREQDLSCNPYNYVDAGYWKLENNKTLRLYINQTLTNSGQTSVLVPAESSYILEEVTADTLKLKQNLLFWDSDLNTTVPGVDRLTFVRKR
ncbi:hypothetical protein ACXYMU_16305 [Pontibacter sp. CAU 1760]